MLLLCLASFSLFANDKIVKPSSIHISYFHPYFEAGKLRIDSQVMFSLSPEMEQALQHQIPLTFDIEVKLLEQQAFYFEREVKTIHYQIKVLYFNYSHKFIISNQRSQANQSFTSLKDALQTFGTIRNFKIIDLADLSSDKTYSIAFRVSFNRWKLPTPLIIDSFLDKSWYLASDWRKMTLPRLE